MEEPKADDLMETFKEAVAYMSAIRWRGEYQKQIIKTSNKYAKKFNVSKEIAQKEIEVVFVTNYINCFKKKMWAADEIDVKKELEAGLKKIHPPKEVSGALERCLIMWGVISEET